MCAGDRGPSDEGTSKIVGRLVGFLEANTAVFEREYGMKDSVFPVILVFFLGLNLFPVGLEAQMGPGMTGHGMEPGWPGYDRPFTSLGEQIYYTGVDLHGPIPRYGGPMWLRMHGGGCVSCHGIKGRGGMPVMMGAAIPADITYQALMEDHYTDALIKRAIAQGIDEEGKPLDWTMPRWYMPEADLNALIEYLKSLK
jgi:cytochrome c oxidase subunit 2